MPIAPPRIVKHGFDHPKWTMEVVCKSREDRKNKGCGALVEVKKDHLYVVDAGGGFSEEREDVCFDCGCGNTVRAGDISQFNFKIPLPKKEQDLDDLDS